MKKLVLSDEDIKMLEAHIGSLPSFARNVNETLAVSQAVQELMKFLGSKIVQEDEAEPIRN
jgi:cytochrome c553